MSTAYIKITTARSLHWLDKPSNNPWGMIKGLMNLFRGFVNGAYSGFVQVALSSTAANATGTVTAAAVLSADTVTINGQVITAQDLREIRTVLCVADVAGSLNSKFWHLYNANNSIHYYVWYNINAAGVDPAVAGATGIQVTGATNATAATIATSTKTALDAIAGTPFVTSIATATLTITNSGIGTCTDSSNGSASPGFTITTTNQGAATPTLEYFSMSGTNAQTATSLANAINISAQSLILGNVTSAAVSNIVTITAIDTGDNGNLVTLATSNNTRLAKSGTTLTGGTDIVYKNYNLGRSSV